MLLLLTGVPGSGKTLSLVKRFLIPAIQSGRKVYTNIEGLHFVWLSVMSGVSPENISNFVFPLPDSSINSVILSMPPGVLLLVDEAQKHWGNRDFKTGQNREILSYFQEHRHKGHDIVLATQQFEQVDIGARRVADVHYRLKRLRSLGFNKVVKLDVYDQGETMDCKPLASEAWTIDRRFFNCYKSYVSSDIVEVGHKSHNVFFSSLKLWVVFGIVLVGFLWLFFHKPRSVAMSSSVSAPAAFSLGVYEDYYCAAEGLYVLRPGGVVDTLPVKGVPVSVCPHLNYRKNGGAE